MHSQERGPSWNAPCPATALSLSAQGAMDWPAGPPVNTPMPSSVALCTKIKGPLKSSIGGFGLLLPDILVSSSLGLKLTLQLIEQFPIRLFCATKQFS